MQPSGHVQPWPASVGNLAMISHPGFCGYFSCAEAVNSIISRA